MYVAFVNNVYARRIVGWRASRTANARFVLDALEQAIYQHTPAQAQLVHHPDRNICRSNTLNGSQKLKLLRPSVASGGSYDNALAETINGLFNVEVIHRRGPWGSFEAVEYATLEWVDWFNNRRLMESIGNIAPTEVEVNYHAALERSDMAA